MLKIILTIIFYIEDGLWEEMIDFTKISKGGVDIKDLSQRL